MIALGFGGTVLVLGVGGAILSGARGAILPALLGYSLATLPLFLLVAVCRSEPSPLPRAPARDPEWEPTAFGFETA